MAVNDTVNEYFSATTTFIPAASVEICIITTFMGSDTIYMGMTDGVEKAQNYTGYNYSNPMRVSKFIITNTDYFLVNASGAYTGFSGIQIK
jgi:hypothetical protein